MEVVVGVDSHKATFAAAVVDLIGRPVETRQYPNDPKGYEEFLRWAKSKGELSRIGVEGSELWGAGLTRFLLRTGQEVREVPTRLAYREAKRRHAQGKSDPSDALAIARVVAREELLPSPRRPAVTEELKLLSDYRDQLRRARNQLTNRIHKDLGVAYPGYHHNIANLGAKVNLVKVLKLIRGDVSLRAALMRQRVADVQRIDKEILRVQRIVEQKVRESGTTLTTIPGVGALTAARLLGEVGDIRKIRSKAAFGHITGTAPVPASSGTTVRFRLSRAGNRRLNHALHYMALTQFRIHPEAKAYIARRRAEGKSFREALRCLKRHLANVVYRQMVTDALRREGSFDT